LVNDNFETRASIDKLEEHDVKMLRTVDQAGKGGA